MSKPSKPYLNAVLNVGAVLREFEGNALSTDAHVLRRRIRSAVNVALGVEDELAKIPGERDELFPEIKARRGGIRYDGHGETGHPDNAVPIDDDSADFEDLPQGGPAIVPGWGDWGFEGFKVPTIKANSITIGPIGVSEEMRDMLMGVETIGEPESITTVEQPHFERGQEMYVNGERYVIIAVDFEGSGHERYSLSPDPKGQLAAKIERELAMTRLTDTISDAAGRFTKGVSESVMAFYRSQLAVDDQAGHDQDTDQPEGAENGREG